MKSVKRSRGNVFHGDRQRWERCQVVVHVDDQVLKETPLPAFRNFLNRRGGSQPRELFRSLAGKALNFSSVFKQDEHHQSKAMRLSAGSLSFSSTI